MKVDVNFREKLLLGYLNSLASFDYMGEFMKFYPMMETALVEMAKSSKEVNTLEKVNTIFAYRKKSIEKQL